MQMMKRVWPIFIGIILLAACQNSGSKEKTEKNTATNIPQVTVEKKADITFPYPNLLAENDQSYSLLVIGEQDNNAPIEKNKMIIKDVKNILSLPTREMANKIYPELQIESAPAYLLFDNDGKVNQSKNAKELSRYLKANPAK